MDGQSSAATASALGGGGGGQARVSLKDLCCLFCCPPWPASIVSKLAFTPPEPSYKIVTDENDSEKHKLVFVEGRAEWPHGYEELKDIDVYFTESSRGNKIACMYVKPIPKELCNFTILFSHANAVDLGHMSSFFYLLGYRLGCNVFSYDYSGYGCSEGKATEKNLYADVQCAFDSLLSRYDVRAEQVILYGQSIGTVPSIDLGARVTEVAALVLHSPLMSGMRVAFPQTTRTWCFDAFPSIEKIRKVTAPTLVIHGVDDEVIDFSHGLAIYEKAPNSVEPLWVPNAGHNDIEMNPSFLDRLKEFIDNEAGTRPPTSDENSAALQNGGGSSSNGGVPARSKSTAAR